MYYLIYISTAVNLASQKELAEILVKSQANNALNNITGLLLYSQGTFIQALEGDAETVTETYNKIEKDDRHKNMIVLANGISNHRAFAGWSMAFVALDPDKMKDLEGYINPLKKELFKENDTNQAINIMKTFAENNNLTNNK